MSAFAYPQAWGGRPMSALAYRTVSALAYRTPEEAAR